MAKLEYIENEMKKLDELAKRNESNLDDIIGDYQELLVEADNNNDHTKALALRLKMLEINNYKNDNGFDIDNFNNYTKILDLYIKLELYQEAYDFCIETYNKEFDLCDGNVYDELIHLYKYIPCLFYKFGMEEEYEAVSNELFRMIKHFATEELDGDLKYYGDVYFSGSKVYTLLKEYDKAIEFLSKSREYYLKSEAEYKEQGLLTPELVEIFKNNYNDFCDSMAEAYTLMKDIER